MSNRPSRAEYQRQRRAANKNEQTASPNNRAAQIEAEMEKSFAESLKRLEAGLATTEPGTNAYLKYADAIDDLKRKHREERASRGLDPERLGAAGPTGWHFVATIGRGGAITTVQVPVEKLGEVLAAEQKKYEDTMAQADTPERRAFVARLNAEHGFDEKGNDHSYDNAKREQDPNDYE
jgi:hypothetical protein